MAGKAGRSGRPPGTLSWHLHPTARCGNRLDVLIELWLAFAPERRFTVPPKIKRDLAERAIRETLDNEIESPEFVAVNVDDVLAWSRRQAPDGPSLRRKVTRWRNDDKDTIRQHWIVHFRNPNGFIGWTETDERIVASAATTLTIPN
jgi:hypothetical protein